LSPPGVTRIIAELELRLAVRLLTRTTRVIQLTDAGTRFLDDSRRILAAVTEAEDAAQGLYCKPRGRIGITAPVLFGRLFTNDLLVEFLRRFPGTEVSTLFVDRFVHLPDEDRPSARVRALVDYLVDRLRTNSAINECCDRQPKKSTTMRLKSPDPPGRANYRTPPVG
jgi:hypothetical protein